MFASIVVLVLLVNIVHSQRYTNTFYRDEPLINFPLSTNRKYRVYEGEEDITHDSAGRKLRFAYNPRIARIKSPQFRIYEDFGGLRESRRYEPSSVRSRFPPGDEIMRRYGFRPPTNRPIAHIKQSELIGRARLGYRKIPEEVYVVEYPRPHIRRPIPYYHDYDGRQRLSYDNENEREAERLKINDHLRVPYTPNHARLIQKDPRLLYSPAYPHNKDLPHQIPSSSHFPQYITGIGDGHLFYSPKFKYNSGSSIEKSLIDKDEKKSSNGDVHGESGRHSEEYSEDGQKFKKDEELHKQKSSDTGHFLNEVVKKKLVEDEEKYNGGKSYKQEEQNENEHKNKSSHKKGHVIRSFKNSHHKEETGNKEEYYDEEHDIGDRFNFDTAAGHFGENKEESYKGGREQKEYIADENVNKGNHLSSEMMEKVKEHENENKESKEESNSKRYGSRNIKDEESLLGHQESKRLYEEYPHHIPIHRHL